MGMSNREKQDRQKCGWEETELEIKQRYIAQDAAFCAAVQKAINQGLERVR